MNLRHSQNTPDRTNWNLKKNQIKGMYKLALIDLKNVAEGNISGDLNSLLDSNTTVVPIWGTGRKYKLPSVFLFPVNPKSISLEEPASVTIVALQNGGKYVEHQGSIFKNITISGNTGLRPNKKEKTSVIPIPFTNIDSFFGNKDEVPLEEETGFDSFIHLRNIFRAYFDAKKDINLASRIVMLWGNSQEEDFYIVEPMSFRTSRDTSSRFTFNYEITLRTLGPLDLYSIFDNQSKGLGGFLDAINTIKNATQSINNFTSFVTSNLDLINRLGRSFVNTILGPINAIMQGVSSVSNSLQGLVTLPRDMLVGVVKDCVGMIRDIQQLKRTAVSAFTDIGDLSVFNELTSAVKGILTNTTYLIVVQKRMGTDRQKDFAKKFAAYDRVEGAAPGSVGELSPPSSARRFGTHKGDFSKTPSAPTAGRQVYVRTNEDIRAISLRTTGSAANWRALVALNNLVAPYISDTGNGIDVLRPGDPIIIPSASTSTDSTITDMVPTAVESGLSPAERALGIDLKLYPSQPYGNDVLYDIKFGNNGDINLITGIWNRLLIFCSLRIWEN
jgi:hypothetical protein